jgi:hypothetical protein
VNSLARNADALDLELLHVGFDAVELAAALADGSRRLVSVLVGSGPSWRRAVRFPNIGSDAGQSFGDVLLDEQVRARAAEELVRLAAAVGAIERRRAA